ncbi:hypothetical protein E2C01_015605 [Portunus trituberculatus]|uniref:Uncharacterized protein n=1 Tax=Portunus trituberculatus TaxID=210409 RepID=A0A5B7DMC3_PORTR|nr:hypothetical protein [Portunus trituberculatus]
MTKKIKRKECKDKQVKPVTATFFLLICHQASHHHYSPPPSPLTASPPSNHLSPLIPLQPSPLMSFLTNILTATTTYITIRHFSPPFAPPCHSLLLPPSPPLLIILNAPPLLSPATRRVTTTTNTYYSLSSIWVHIERRPRAVSRPAIF